MKGFKKTAVLAATIFFISCFGSVSFGINPQPEPPDKAVQFELPGIEKQFDPQPEPPGVSQVIHPEGQNKINPQPEPPGPEKIVKPGGKIYLNPQPEPPGPQELITPEGDGQLAPGVETLEPVEEEEEPIQTKSINKIKPMSR